MKAQVRPELLYLLLFFYLYLVHMDRSASCQSYCFSQWGAWQFLLPMIPEIKGSTAVRRRIGFIVWTVRPRPMPSFVSIMAPTVQHIMSTAAPSASEIAYVSLLPLVTVQIVHRWRLLPKTRSILGTPRLLPSAPLLMYRFLPLWPFEIESLIEVLILGDSWAYKEGSRV